MSIKDYFSFTKGEKRGVIFLLMLIVIVTVSINSIKYLKLSKTTDFSIFENEINNFEKELTNKKSEDSIAKIKKNDFVLTTDLFDFNPNSINDEEWLKLGFKEWQIKAINNYKSKGGEFKMKSDVRKIYGLTDTLYQLLLPHILLPDEKENNFGGSNSKQTNQITYFNFDPNTITKDQWEKLGFKDWQIKTIFNYKEKGGSWKTKADVKKIYGLAETDFNKLEPYILLPNENPSSEKTFPKKDYNKKVNINTADAKEFTNLKGINSEKYAQIIIKYRNDLGGFIRKEQLKEVWNLKIETYNEFVNQIELGQNSPRLLNINKVTEDELKLHPYVGWKLAKTIIAYRNSHGSYKNIDDIKQIHLVTDEIYTKIAPYLTVK